MSKKDKLQPKQWKNRIVGFDTKPASDFTFNPENWRKHPASQRDALTEIFEKIGWVAGVIENKTTGRLIDGHARIEEALAVDPKMPIPFLSVELTEAEERTMLLLLDPIGAMATPDPELFQQLVDISDIDSAGLLEAIAGISRSELIDVAALPRQKDENEAAVLLNYLKFDGKSIPLTEEELEELNRRFDTYVEENGVVYGFVSELLGK